MELAFINQFIKDLPAAFLFPGGDIILVNAPGRCPWPGRVLSDKGYFPVGLLR